MNYIEELQWRGMLHNKTENVEELFEKENMVTAYVGIDPTADSLHIGHLVSIMMLKHFQRFGHKPLLVVGGATGMIGDPSGKSEERNLLDIETIRKNQEAIKKQLTKFLDFDENKKNNAEILNNYDWIGKFSFIDFIRDIGKHITVNYMLAKDSVKKRIGQDGKSGMSFTEFSYQLVQATDFWHLYKTYNCKLQLGGSDQWGNITTGIELIRRKESGIAHGITCPLITRSDGKKFGKTETGNVWLDPEKTSPYKFYQFWLNVSDEDAEKYIKIFTILPKEEIDNIINEHKQAPEKRLLQKTLAKEITTMVHSEEDYKSALEASQILFSKQPLKELQNIDEKTFLDVFEGVPQFKVDKSMLGKDVVTFLAETGVMPSKGETRRLIKNNGISINKEKVKSIDQVIDESYLINSKYILAQKGKKNYYLIVVEAEQ
jgi:tyrosyl-tRNA synthetase